MSHVKKIKSLSVAFAIFTVANTSISFANTINADTTTIIGNSILWGDEVNKRKLLESVPSWQTETITALFDAYKHPDRYQLTSPEDDKKYNTQFINLFWGPLDNPFNQYPRPSKAFVFISHENAKSFYLAPLIKNSTDGNYYIFDKNQTKPLLLNDWISQIGNTEGNSSSIRFNICNGYGSLPNDVCNRTSYQSEIESIYQTNHHTLTAQEITPSAARGFHEDWRSKVKNSSRLKNTTGNHIYIDSIPWDDAVSRNALLHTVETWPNYQVIKTNFEKIRDLRYFLDEYQTDFARRISWLYPDDGCWTRASAVIKDFFGPINNLVNPYQRPSKIFAFGNLCANTPNSPTQNVTWWYHTAPIIRDAETNQDYVLDPSVNPHEPLTVEKWIAEITSQSGACASSDGKIETFNICNGYGTGPYDNCQTSYLSEVGAVSDQKAYQYYERQRQIKLGRDANQVLGDLPPWLNKNKPLS